MLVYQRVTAIDYSQAETVNIVDHQDISVDVI
jgi:hypothetical protein